MCEANMSIEILIIYGQAYEAGPSKLFDEELKFSLTLGCFNSEESLQFVEHSQLHTWLNH